MTKSEAQQDKGRVKLVLGVRPEVTFEVDFGGARVSFTARPMGPNELADWLAASANESTVVALGKVLTGWAGPVGAKDAPLPYSRAALAQLLDTVDDAVKAIVPAYMAACAESARKN